MIFLKTHLSSKLELEESDTCTNCNLPFGETIETIEDEPPVVVNKVELFCNGDGYWNGRLAIEYINMCESAQFSCDQCKYVSVMNEGTGTDRTGGWKMQSYTVVVITSNRPANLVNRQEIPLDILGKVKGCN